MSAVVGREQSAMVEVEAEVDNSSGTMNPPYWVWGTFASANPSPTTDYQPRQGGILSLQY